MKTFFRILLISLATIITVILIAASVYKLYLLQMVPHTPEQFAAHSIEIHYADHLFLAYIHIIPGLLFLILGSIQFLPVMRRKFARTHRMLGKLFLILAVLIFITAIILAVVYPFGNVLETIVTLVFGIFLLIATYKAYRSARQKQFLVHRNWVTRVFFIALAVSTIRGVIGLLMANGEKTLQEVFGLAFLISFIIHLLIVEVWIRFLAGKRI